MSAGNRGDERDDPVVSAAKQGDADAWRELYRAHAGRLVVWLTHRDGDATGSAEDLCSETWLTAAGKIHEFHGTCEEFGGWLFGIARRHAANARRSQGRRATAPTDPATLALQGDQPVSGPDAIVPERAWLREALAALSTRERDVITCLEVIGMDVATTCAALGMSAVAVRVARHRGLKRLRRLLGEEPERDPGHPAVPHFK